MQLLKSQNPDISRLSLKNDCCLVPTGSFQMPINTVGAHVEFSTHEPLRKRRFPIQTFLGGRKPREILFGDLCPKLFRLTQRFLIHRFVTGKAGEDCLFHKRGAGFVLFWVFQTNFFPFFCRRVFSICATISRTGAIRPGPSAPQAKRPSEGPTQITPR